MRLFAALQFLTTIAVPRVKRESDFGTSIAYFPVVGFILGLILAGTWWVLNLIVTPAISGALVIVLLVLLTGAMHLDGLADTVDGLGGGHTVEERLAIMKDSRVGTFGVLALVLALVLKFSFFLSLAGKGTAAALILYPVVSRWGMVLLAYLSPYARPEGGLGQAMTTGVSSRVLAGATVSAAALSAAAFGVRGPILLAAAGLLVWLGSLYCRKTLGGVTGDVLGAANEALEVLVLGGGPPGWLVAAGPCRCGAPDPVFSTRHFSDKINQRQVRRLGGRGGAPTAPAFRVPGFPGTLVKEGVMLPDVMEIKNKLNGIKERLELLRGHL